MQRCCVATYYFAFGSLHIDNMVWDNKDCYSLRWYISTFSVSLPVDNSSIVIWIRASTIGKKQY